MRQQLFNVIVVWAWAIGMFVDPVLYTDGDSLPLYLLTIAPAAIFIATNYQSYIRSTYSYTEVALVFFLLVVCVIAAPRGDVQTIVSMSALVLMLIAIFHSKVTINLILINILFIASICASIITYYIGINPYGFLPGQSEGGADLGLQWRISLFPYAVLNSWGLALIVIATNYFLNKSWSRWLYINAAMYFFVLSASRTGLVVFVVAIFFLFLTKIFQFRDRPMYKMLLPGVLLGVVGLLHLPTLLIHLSSFDNAIINGLLYRSELGPADNEQITESIFRTILWKLHLTIFADNPFFGYGTFIFGEIYPEYIAMSGSESFLTGMMARTGFVSFLFIWFLFSVSYKTLKEDNQLGYCFAILIFISSITYGSYLVPYNFLFLILFAGLNKPRLPAECGSYKTQERRGSIKTVLNNMQEEVR